MKVIELESREEYIKVQIERSEQKFQYCKVSINHVYSWRQILRKNKIPDPKRVLCMGTRNGREVDLFRSVFFHPVMARAVKAMEVERSGWTSILPVVEGVGRSDIGHLAETGVYGCEINPRAKRKDIFIGSFDELPCEWAGSFDLIYSNSFDQSLDPGRTAKEWIRCLKPGGCVIIGFAETPPTHSDPVGDLSILDIMGLFPGELIFFGKNHSNYHDAIIRF